MVRAPGQLVRWGIALVACKFLAVEAQQTRRKVNFYFPLEPNQEDYWNTIAVGGLIAYQQFVQKNQSIIDALGDDSVKSSCADMTVEFALFETQGTASVAISQFLNTKETLDAVVGPAYSGVSTALSLVSNHFDRTLMSYSATSPSLSNRYGDTSRFTRSNPSDTITAAAVCSYLESNGVTHAGVIYQDDSYGAGFRDELVASCATEMYPTSYEAGVAESIDTVVKQTKGRSLNVNILVIYDDDLIPFLEKMTEMGLAGEGRLLVLLDGVTKSGFESAVDTLGDTAVTALAHAIRIYPDGVNSGTGFKNLEQWWTKEGPAHVDEFNKYIFSATGQNLTSDFFSKQEIHEYVPFAFDSTVALLRALCFSLATGSDSGNSVGQSNGTSVYNQLIGDSFEGVTGSVEIDKETGTRTAATSRIGAQTITYSDSQVVTPVVLQFYDNQWSPTGLGESPSIPPSIEFVENENFVPRGLKIGSMVLVSLLAAVIVAFMVYTWQKRATRIFMRSQPKMLLLFLFGALLSVVSLYFTGVENVEEGSDSYKSFACNAFYWFWALGVSLTFAALIVKLYRIYLIFNNRQLRKIKITNKDLYFWIFCIVSVDLVVLVVWSAFSPLRYERETSTFDSYGNPLESFGVCTSDYSSIFQIILFSYQGVLFVAGVVFSYKARKADSDYQESQYISISLVSQFQLYIIGLPLIFVFRDADSIARFLVIFAIIFFNVLILVMVMYIPKIVALGKNIDRAASFGATTQGGYTTQNNTNACSMVQQQQTTTKDLSSDLSSEEQKRLKAYSSSGSFVRFRGSNGNGSQTPVMIDVGVQSVPENADNQGNGGVSVTNSSAAGASGEAANGLARDAADTITDESVDDVSNEATGLGAKAISLELSPM